MERLAVVSGPETKSGFVERFTQQPEESQERGAKSAWQEEREFEALEFKNWWSRSMPRRCNTVLQAAHGCEIEGCGNLHIQFKRTHLPSDVVHAVVGVHTRTT